MVGLSRDKVVSLFVLLGSFALLYRHVIVKLVHDWATDDNYSHGFLIVPIALYLAWERRQTLIELPQAPKLAGLVVVLGSLGLLAAGTLGAELFLTRISIIGVVAGSILFLFGWNHVRALAFPIGFLILMVPLPAIIFNQIAFPLQLLASQAGELTLSTLGIPVLREGNVIVLAHTTLEVAEACSGIRSLVSLITLALVYGYFTDSRWIVRAAITLSAVPVAIAANAMRVAGTGVAAQYYGPSVAEGFFHEFSGWLLFLIAFMALFGVRHLLVYSLRLSERFKMRPAAA